MLGSRKLRVLFAGAAVAMVATACGSGGSSAAGGKQKVKLGALVTTSGVNGFVGVSASNAFEVAVTTVNADPAKYLGSADRTLAITIKDAGETTSQAIALARSMSQDSSIQGLVGPSTSPQALALGPFAQQASIPLVAPHSPAPDITKPGDFVFQIAATNDLLAAEVIKKEVPRLKLRKVGVIYSPDNNANLLAGKTVKQSLAALGVPAVEFTLPATDQDYTGAIAKVRDAGCDGVFIATNAPGVASAIIQADRTNYHPQWLGNPIFANKAVFENAGRASVGSILATDYNPNLATPLNETFRTDFQKKAHTTADPYAAQAFSTVLTVAGAIRAIPAGKEVTRESLKGALAQVKDVDVVVGEGKLRMSPSRTAQITPALLTINNKGGFDPVR